MDLPHGATPSPGATATRPPAPPVPATPTPSPSPNPTPPATATPEPEPEPTPPPPVTYPRRLTRELAAGLLEGAQLPVEPFLIIVFGPTARCPNGESTGRTDAISPGGHAGWLQIDVPSHKAKVELVAGRSLTYLEAQRALLDPEVNVQVARLVYLEAEARWGDGLRPWSCRPDALAA